MLTTLRKIFGLNTEEVQEERTVIVTQTDKFGDVHTFQLPESSAYLAAMLLLKENIKSLEEELANYKLRDLAVKEPLAETYKYQTPEYVDPNPYKITSTGETPIILLENQPSDDTHQIE